MSSLGAVHAGVGATIKAAETIVGAVSISLSCQIEQIQQQKYFETDNRYIKDTVFCVA